MFGEVLACTWSGRLGLGHWEKFDDMGGGSKVGTALQVLMTERTRLRVVGHHSYETDNQ